jgi:hypothetical protein
LTKVDKLLTPGPNVVKLLRTQFKNVRKLVECLSMASPSSLDRPCKIM